MNLEEQKKAVIERLIREGYIKSKRVIDALLKVPREEFVPEHLKEYAYVDTPLEIGHGQTISAIHMVGMMSELLDLKPGMKVLEIGTGSGYQTAIFAELAKGVFTIERVDDLMLKAKKILDRLGYFNVAYKTGDGTLGWPEMAPFQGIIVTAAAPDIPLPYLEQLDVGGRIVIPIGDRWAQVLYKVTKLPNGEFKKENLGGCRFVPLIGEYGWPE